MSYTQKTQDTIKTLGENAVDGDDYIVLIDGASQIVVKYGSAKLFEQSAEADRDQATRDDWVAQHVLMDKAALLERFARKPLLRGRVMAAIFALYGAYEESTLGKAQS